jgi:hypothetical protein
VAVPSVPKARTGPTLTQRSRRMSPEQKAIIHHQGRRPFFGLAPGDVQDIGAALQRLVSRSLGGRGVRVTATGT